MHRVIKETVKALGGLDIIVNRHTPTHTPHLCTELRLQTAVHAQQRHTWHCLGDYRQGTWSTFLVWLSHGITQRVLQFGAQMVALCLQRCCQH